MAAGEAAGVVQAPLGIVGTDVVTVPLPELFDGILNGPGTNGRFLPSEAGPGRSGSARARRYSRQAAVFPHLLGAEVCMAASTVPVPGDRFGVKRGHDAEVFTHAVQEEARHPQMVAHADPLTRANLELPLQHSFTVTGADSTATHVQTPASVVTWAGITSALVPQIWTPAYRQAL